MSSRPNGKALKRTGGLAFIAGLAAVLVNSISFLLPGVLNYHPISELLTFTAIFGILLGALTWMAGHIIFAISFLPGRDD